MHVLSEYAVKQLLNKDNDLRSVSAAAFDATERRLYALPILRECADDTKEQLAALEANAADALKHHRVYMAKLGYPKTEIDPEDAAQAVCAALRGRLIADEQEIKRLDNALASIRQDPYYDIIPAKYFNNEKPDAIAGWMHCDPATVRRNCKRLVSRLAMRLYGVECI